MNISIDYRFKPFDMAPIIDTMNAYNTLYEKEQQMYDTLALKLGDLSSAVQGTTLAKGIYDNYMNRLLFAADNFTGGRDINTARELGLLRRMYGTDIRLLELARETMLANTKILLQLHAADPSMILLNVGNLDVYLNNPTYQPQGFSGDKLSDKTSKLILAMYRDVVSLGYDKEKLDLYHYKLVTLQGLDSKTAAEAINAITNGLEIPNETLRNIAALVFNLTGVASWGDPSAVTKTWDAIKNGISGGVGTVNMQVANDVAALKALDWSYRLKELLLQELYARAREARAAAREDAKARQALMAQLGVPVTSVDFRGKTSPIYDVDAKTLQTDAAKFDKYFDKRTGHLTLEGLKEYKKIYNAPAVSSPTTGVPIIEAKSGPSPFKLYLDKLSMATTGKPFLTDELMKTVGFGSWVARRGKDLQQASKDAVRKGAGLSSSQSLNTDAIKNNEYIIDVTSTARKNLFGMINDGAVNSKGNLVVETWDDKTKKNIQNSVTYDMENEKINNSKITAAVIVAGPRGNHVRITTADGKKYRVPMRLINSGLNDLATVDYSNALKSSSTAYKYENLVIYIGPKPDGTMGVLTPELVKQLPNEYLPLVRRTTFMNEFNSQLNIMLLNLISALEVSEPKVNQVEGGRH